MILFNPSNTPMLVKKKVRISKTFIYQNIVNKLTKQNFTGRPVSNMDMDEAHYKKFLTGGKELPFRFETWEEGREILKDTRAVVEKHLVDLTLSIEKSYDLAVNDKVYLRFNWNDAVEVLFNDRLLNGYPQQIHTYLQAPYSYMTYWPYIIKEVKEQETTINRNNVTIEPYKGELWSSTHD